MNRIEIIKIIMSQGQSKCTKLQRFVSVSISCLMSGQIRGLVNRKSKNRKDSMFVVLLKDECQNIQHRDIKSSHNLIRKKKLVCFFRFLKVIIRDCKP